VKTLVAASVVRMLSKQLIPAPVLTRCTPVRVPFRSYVTVKSTKGFGGPNAEEKTQPNVKVNDRGKVSSRPGAPSVKGSRRRQDEASSNQIQSTDDVPTAATATPAPPSTSAAAKPEAEPQMPMRRMETPQVVVDRMFGRMIACAGLPVAVGLLLLPVFYVLKVAQGDDFPIWVVYISQLLTFGGGLFGITYGILSTSWDPTREGSVLGWEEFKANLPLLLNRNKT